MKEVTPEQFDIAYRGEEFRLGMEELLKRLGLRMQMGWKGKHAYLQLVDENAPSNAAITVFKVSKDARMRWCLDDEAQRPVSFTKAQCGECGATLCEAGK